MFSGKFGKFMKKFWCDVTGLSDIVKCFCLGFNGSPDEYEGFFDDNNKVVQELAGQKQINLKINSNRWLQCYFYLLEFCNGGCCIKFCNPMDLSVTSLSLYGIADYPLRHKNDSELVYESCLGVVGIINVWLSCCFPVNFCFLFSLSDSRDQCVNNCIEGELKPLFSNVADCIDDFLMGLVLNFIQTLKGVTQIFCCGSGLFMADCYGKFCYYPGYENFGNTIEKTKMDIAATDPCVNLKESSYLAYLRYLGINPNHNEFIRVMRLTARISRVNKNCNSFVREGVISNQSFGNFWLPLEIFYHIFSFLFATNNNQDFNIACSYSYTDTTNFPFPDTNARYPNDEKRFLVLVVYQLFIESCKKHQKEHKQLSTQHMVTFFRRNDQWCKHCDDRKTKFEKSVQNQQNDKRISLFDEKSPLLSTENETTSDDLSVIINIPEQMGGSIFR